MAQSSYARPLSIALTALLLAVGGWFWLADRSLDPPMYFDGLGQSLSTDAPQYVYHARNAELFGDSDPFDYPRWTVYRNSLTSALAFTWFAVVGSSFGSAAVVGILLSLGGLVLFLIALYRHHAAWTLPFVATLFLSNVCLFTYGRLSYLENGLIFITGALFAAYSWFGRRTWGIVVSGMLAAAAMISGKLFGALLLPALLLAEYFSTGERRWFRIRLILAAFFSTAGLMVLVLFSDNLAAVLGYFSEQTYGLRGFPKGLRTPWDFVESLISYGFGNRLFFLSLNLPVLIFLTSLSLFFWRSSGHLIADLSPIARLALFSVALILLGLMPLSYSPLRYGLFLVPAILIAFVTLLDSQITRSIPPRTGPLPTGLVTAGIGTWILLYHAISAMWFVNATPTRPLVWGTLAGALLVTFLLSRASIGSTRAVPRSLLYGVAALVLLGSVGLHVYRFDQRVFQTRNYNTIEASADIARILSPEAVISGAYGPVLTMDNGLKSFIHLFGVAEVDSTLFERFPITHLAIDQSNYEEMIANYPELARAQLVTTYFIRDYEVKLFSMTNVSRNPVAQTYQPTAYERAAGHYFAGRPDSALFWLAEFVKTDQSSKSANLMLADLLFQRGQAEQARTILVQLTGLYPTDFFVHLQTAQVYQIVAIQTRDPQHLDMANRYYARAVELNPFRSNYAQQIYNQINRRLSSPSGSTQP